MGPTKKKITAKKTGIKNGQKQLANTDLPRKTVEECLKIANAIYSNYGDSDASIDELATALNSSPKTVAFKYLLWGAQAYGLIIKNGDRYTLTETSRKIFQPESEQQRKEAVVKAITIPNILSRIYSDFNGKLLPEGEFFDNILLSRYSIPKERISESEEVILANAQFAGLLTSHDSGKKIIRLDGAPIRQDPPVDLTATKTIVNASDKVCFYITPIGEDGTDIRKHADMLLKHLIEPAFEQFNYKVIRADKIEKSGLISQQIFELLVSAQICVADLSYGNPNAFYELGVRHMTKKPTIQTIRKGDKIPFDVSQGRTIIVDVSDIFTVMDKMESAKNELIEHIKAIVDPKSSGLSDDNPVSIYLPSLSVKI